MECNKDEATRAKEVAERKFVAKELSGAKKFALKAEKLFPSLEGIPQMIAKLDVYISAENKVKGETDWYGILGVDPHADDDTVKKQFRKLALMLHPDKNKSVGADGAFKHVSEAWSILSDKERRAAYDEKINVKAQKGSTIFGGSSAKAAANGANNGKKKPPSGSRTRKSPAKEETPSSSDKPPSGSRTRKSPAKEETSSSSSKPQYTFWTTCQHCKMQYEYVRLYLNLKLVCPRCREAFLALETNPPAASGIRPWDTLNFMQKPDHQGPHKSKSNAGKNNMAAPFSNSGVSNVAQDANVVQKPYRKVKRDREEAQAATKKEDALRRKRTRGGMEGNGACSGIKNFNCTRDLTPIELKNLLVEKARKEISKKLSEFQSNTADKSVEKKSGDCFQKEDRKGKSSARNSE
ncbi:hypothetical protein QL285_031972 [Trifolium repens]|nr:hypothetical protein QL285_031972 [Trifolium repens]